MPRAPSTNCATNPTATKNHQLYPSFCLGRSQQKQNYQFEQVACRDAVRKIEAEQKAATKRYVAKPKRICEQVTRITIHKRNMLAVFKKRELWFLCAVSCALSTLPVMVADA